MQKPQRRQASVDADSRDVWNALRALADAEVRAALAGAAAIGRSQGRGPYAVAADSPDALFARDASGLWQPAPGLGGAALALAALYLPVVTAESSRCYVVGHLGQSLDGCIATRSGDSDFVTGPENLDHLHRMRALCKAVVVGAGTIAADDPELTTRRVEGPSPTRVVLDPQRRLARHHRVFTDGKAETWLVCADTRCDERAPARARVVGLPLENGELALDVLLARLHAAGLVTVFVEGGGVTVSRFLRANLLDRMQITIAPLVIGSGRLGLSAPGPDSLGACLRPRCRIFAMGRDALFDCEPQRSATDAVGTTALRRIV